MNNADQNIIGEIFNEEAKPFYEELVKTLKETLDQKKIRASEKLINSLKAAVVEASENAEGKIYLSFQDYGRIRDMRKVIYTSQPPVDLIKEWVENLGIEKFKYVPGYQRGGFPSRDIAASRIAWGIARNNFKKRIVTRTKKEVWYASPVWTAINKLEGKMAKRYADIVVRKLIKSTKK